MRAVIDNVEEIVLAQNATLTLNPAKVEYVVFGFISSMATKMDMTMDGT